MTGDIGYYSQVAIGKYTQEPTVFISSLEDYEINPHTYNYTGFYSNEDTTEIVYTYQFDLFDEANNIKFTTGELLHSNINNENLTESFDECIISMDLGSDIYYLQYTVTTINKIVVKSPKYAIQQAIAIPMDIVNPVLTAKADAFCREDAYISLSFAGDPTYDVNGLFIIYRSDEDSNFYDWRECYRMTISGNFINSANTYQDFWRDYAVQSGKKYKYAIAQSNDEGVISEKVVTLEPISVYFEYSYLFDGERQLKIKFDSDMTNLKQQTSDAKITTIGNKYPYVFRNGYTSYKEFPLSGLISYLMDTTGSFNKENEGLPININLTYENTEKERKFKNEVLDWLVDGKPKLFKSATEGNFIVALTSVSLKPTNKKLGRFLHNFTATASEIADCTYENLNKFNIIKSAESAEEETPIKSYWASVEVESGVELVPEGQTVYLVDFSDLEPGTLVEMTTEDGMPRSFIIGATGTYSMNKNIGVTSLKVNSTVPSVITYSFQEKWKNEFSTYKSVERCNIPSRQFIGKTDIFAELAIENDPKISKDKLQILRVKLEARPVEHIFVRDGIRYFEDGEIVVGDYSKTLLYAIYNDNNDFIHYEDYSKGNEPIITMEKDFSVSIGDYSLDLYDSKNFFTTYPISNEIKIGTGVIADISYSYVSMEYVLEDKLQQSKNEWLEAQDNLYNTLQNLNKDFEDRIAASQNVVIENNSLVIEKTLIRDQTSENLQSTIDEANLDIDNRANEIEDLGNELENYIEAQQNAIKGKEDEVKAAEDALLESQQRNSANIATKQGEYDRSVAELNAFNAAMISQIEQGQRQVAQAQSEYDLALQDRDYLASQKEKAEKELKKTTHEENIKVSEKQIAYDAAKAAYVEVTPPPTAPDGYEYETPPTAIPTQDALTQAYKSIFGPDFVLQFDEDGQIVNYDSLVLQAYEIYNQKQEELGQDSEEFLAFKESWDIWRQLDGFDEDWASYDDWYNNYYLKGLKKDGTEIPSSWADYKQEYQLWETNTMFYNDTEEDAPKKTFHLAIQALEDARQARIVAIEVKKDSYNVANNNFIVAENTLAEKLQKKDLAINETNTLIDQLNLQKIEKENARNDAADALENVKNEANIENAAKEEVVVQKRLELEEVRVVTTEVVSEKTLEIVDATNALLQAEEDWRQLIDEKRIISETASADLENAKYETKRQIERKKDYSEDPVRNAITEEIRISTMEIQEKIEAVETAYLNYVLALKKALDEQKRMGGI